ncbi:MAG: family peptidase [Moraxellaceae bacterium]|jgi:putative peptide zinc metalloprotease protein|nr:family peptidase [Moraxellaceae bacterium]
MNAPDLFSPEWYRVAAMRPLLRRQVQVSRQQFRGETWMVLREPGSNRLFRVTQAAWEILSRFDGTRDLDSLWKEMCELLGDEVPTQGEVLRLVTQLAASDLLLSELPPDLAELGERSRDIALKRVLGYFKSPLALRLPLFDPDRLITATLPLGSWLFSRRGFLIWIAIVSAALFQVAMHWKPLTQNMFDQLLATENLLLLGLLYPVLKLIHEFGHGWAVKRWGGEVRELGVMFLIFIPTPYVDASHASFFKDKRQRMLVGFAGMQVELLIAAVATFVWVAVEPGLVRAVAYNLMTLAGISAVLFNGNPLLRFDAYHILADWLEMPGFGNRANQYIGYLLQTRVLRMDVPNPAQSPREARWFAFYAIAAFAYKLIVTFGIVFAIAGRFFIFGVLLGILSFANALVLPAWRVLKAVATDHRYAQARPRAWQWLAGSLTGLVLFAVFVPLPSYTVTEGVVWVPESARVYAGADGVMTQVLQLNGATVKEGELVAQLDNPELDTSATALAARVQELDLRYREAAAESRSELAILAEEYDRAVVEYEDAEQRLAGLDLLAPGSGTLALEERHGLLGRYITRGTVVGYVISGREVLLRVVVGQDDIDQVRQHTKYVQVRFASDPGKVIEVRQLHEVPEAQRLLPSAALSLEGGGAHALDPSAQQELRSIEPLFQFELAAPARTRWRVGERVYVRFVHRAEPLWDRVRRDVRRVFLRRLDV